MSTGIFFSHCIEVLKIQLCFSLFLYCFFFFFLVCLFVVFCFFFFKGIFLYASAWILQKHGASGAFNVRFFYTIYRKIGVTLQEVKYTLLIPL